MSRHHKCKDLAIVYSGNVDLCDDDPLVKRQIRELAEEKQDRASRKEEMESDDDFGTGEDLRRAPGYLQYSDLYDNNGYPYALMYDKIGPTALDIRIDRTGRPRPLQDARNDDLYGPEDFTISRYQQEEDRDAPEHEAEGGGLLSYDDEDVEMGDISGVDADADDEMDAMSDLDNEELQARDDRDEPVGRQGRSFVLDYDGKA